LRGELVADGFRVEIVAAVPADDEEAVVRERGLVAGGPIAAGLFLDDAWGADVVLIDTRSGRSVRRQLFAPSTGPEEAPKVLARHTVDLLRGALLDFAIAGLRSVEPPSPKPPPPPVPAPPALAPSTSTPRWALEGGLGVLTGFGGIGASVAPALRLRFAPTRELQLRLTGAGLGSNPTVQTGQGSATVEQAVALVDGTAVLGHSRWFRPLFTLGAGAYFAAVTGSAAVPYQGETANGIALALDGGLGFATTISPSLDLSLEAHVLVTEPGIAVRIVDQEIGRLGQPTLLVTLTLVDWI
jgi:hypothetical protein